MRSMPSRKAAVSMISKYLDLISERDAYSPELDKMRATNGPCIEEMYGDSFSSYWLGRGKLLAFEGQLGDTLNARLELLTVAEQVPASDRAIGSEVRARIKTDTLVMRLVPDSSRRNWQVCGFLSSGHELGGYGRPDNVRYKPASVTRFDLLRQVDSIRSSSAPTERPGTR